MSSRLRLAAIVMLCILTSTGALLAAQTVTVVSDLEGTQAVFGISQNSSSKTVVNLDIPSVAISNVSVNSAEYKKVQVPEAEHLFAGEISEDGEPDLPVMTSFLAIPDQAEISLSVEYSGYDIIDDIDLAPSQPSPLESGPQDVPFAIDQATYSTDAFYPGELAAAGDPVIMRDIRMVQISMYPVQYNPVRRQLRVYRDLAVSVNYTNDNVVNPKTIHRPYLSDGFYPIYKALVANFDRVFSTAEARRGGYLIITQSMFVDSLRALVQWKHRKGYIVRLVRTTEITPSGNPTSVQVYNFIHTAYDTWDVPPEYVMIVGDKDNTTVSGVVDYPYGGYTSDHHYSTVEGNDYLPDIFVSRLSVDNMTDFRKAASKILTYETQPFLGDPGYWLRGLSVAGNVGSTTPRLTTLWVRQLFLENGFTRVDTSFRSTSGDSDPLLPGYFNAGVSLISYRGWAGSDGWWCPSFRLSNLNSLTNSNKLGVMASLVCGTGDYGDTYNDPCFGETWIRMGTSPTQFKGGPAFFGATDHGTHTKWNNPIMVGYYWGVFKENVYHFAAAAVRGKLQQYRTFPRNIAPGGTIEQYFNTYNMLGDPELDVRTKIPIIISVGHPRALPLGVNHIEVNVTDSAGVAVAGAYVTLNKGYGTNEEVFEVGQTDEAGNISMSFDAPTPDTMFITVSGRDLYPYQGYVLISTSTLAVGFDSLVVDDDNVGFSRGNGDGLINPGENIELALGLKNFGTEQAASNVIAILEPIDTDLVTVYDPRREYGTIAPGQTMLPDAPFLVSLSRSGVDGDIARLKLSVTDDSGDYWFSVVELPIASPKFAVTNVAFAGGNNRFDPGDTSSMVLTLKNMGSVNAVGVMATVSTLDDYTAVLTSTSSFGNIPADSSRTNAVSPMMLTCDPGTFDGRAVNLVLTVTTEDRAISTVPFAVAVGVVQASDPVGPDAYGYYMYDNTDAGYGPRPTFQWVEVNPANGGHGTRINFQSYDDNSRMITLPFDFVYYGSAFRYGIVCTNGFFAVDTSRFDMGGNFWYNFFNWPIPDPGNASGQISPFWDDLQYSGSTAGVYTYYDTTSNRFIIEWSGMTHRNTGVTETFEMIITDPAFYPTITGDAEIYYQYSVISNTDSEENYSSVGFESPEELRGLQYTFDNVYTPGAATLAASRAIRITTNTGRGAIRGVVDLDNGGQNQDVTVSTSNDHSRMTPQSGEYWIKSVQPGIVSVAAEIRGYFPVTMDSVTVNADQTTSRVDFALTKCPIPDGLVASDSLGDRVELTWSAVQDSNLVGYNVYRSRWQNGEFLKLNTDPIAETHYADGTPPDSANYWYYVTAAYAQDTTWSAESFASMKNSGSLYSPSGTGDKQSMTPREFFLSQNYPNPFNPTTTISYGLPHDARVRLDVFNIMGQKVRTLIDGQQTAGYKTVVWDGHDGSGRSVASGVYFYRIDTGDHEITKKMLMIK